MRIFVAGHGLLIGHVAALAKLRRAAIRTKHQARFLAWKITQIN